MELEVIAPKKTNDEWEEEGTKVWYIDVLPKEHSSLLLFIKEAVKLAPNRLPPSSPKLRPHVIEKVMLVGQFVNNGSIGSSTHKYPNPPTKNLILLTKKL
jgi:hypothetical protein